MLDTGCRTDEVLQLESWAIDFENLLLTVNGKGGKQRKVPFSPETRKRLWAYCLQLQGQYVFGTRSDTKLTYRNAYRNMKLCFERVGIRGAHAHPITSGIHLPATTSRREARGGDSVGSCGFVNCSICASFCLFCSRISFASLEDSA